MIDTVRQDILKFEGMLKLMIKLKDSLPDDDEIHSHWAQYMCIKAAALMERSFINILTKYVETHADDRVIRRVTRELERISNPNISVIQDILGHFDNRWKAGINNTLQQKLVDSVNTIMANRNRIAHGREVNITSLTLVAQFRDMVTVIEHVHELVLAGKSG